MQIYLLLFFSLYLFNILKQFIIAFCKFLYVGFMQLIPQTSIWCEKLNP